MKSKNKRTFDKFVNGRRLIVVQHDVPEDNWMIRLHKSNAERHYYECYMQVKPTDEIYNNVSYFAEQPTGIATKETIKKLDHIEDVVDFTAINYAGKVPGQLEVDLELYIGFSTMPPSIIDCWRTKDCLDKLKRMAKRVDEYNAKVGY